MSNPPRLVFIGEDTLTRQSRLNALRQAGISVQTAPRNDTALRWLHADLAAVVISDAHGPGLEVRDLLARCRAQDADLPVMLLCGRAEVALAVEALRSGATDVLAEPVTTAQLVHAVKQALSRGGTHPKAPAALAAAEASGALIGSSAAIQEVRRLVRELADTAVDVLVRGETGAGKAMVARALHQHSRRRHAPFVVLGCEELSAPGLGSELFGHEPGAFPGATERRIGRLEQAHGGTLFLDAVEHLDPALHGRLGRVLQEHALRRLGGSQAQPLDLRIVASTQEDLRPRVQQKTFSADLYYRLQVAVIELPPLRERREDIPLLLEHFLHRAARHHGRLPPEPTPALTWRLMAHDWPGNVRELRQVAESLVLGMKPPRPLAQDEATASAPALGHLVDQFERSLIAAELQRQGGNLTRAAEALRVAKTTLHDKVKRYGLQR